eukprot:CAMPEP_0174269520 /NCGR_PEP_ID=MMETSP0439-20130205/41345_1 /TAXON_ID=0 /ORGANISM="Stereomyxa ramosa, Strain Chinc5" /LENGTH=409 /DNA_ID=CAMNT_0015358353 /DNA_START=124 /DNA_END=1350 /DNA_ORIENTATION=+
MLREKGSELVLWEGVVDVNKYTRHGMNALHNAAYYDQPHCLVTLINYGADPNYLNSFNQTALYLGCSEGNMDIVELLIAWDKQQKELEQSIIQQSAQEEAEEEGYWPVNRLRTDGEGELENGGWSCLHVATAATYSSVVKVLIEELSVDINEMDEYGRTPLHLLVEKCVAPTLAAWLVTKGAALYSDLWVQSHYTTEYKSNNVEEFDVYNMSDNDDVCLVCDDAHFYVEKQILCSNCEYFSAMFSSQMLEAQGFEVNISSVTKESLFGILEFIYTKTISVTNIDTLLEIWEDSDLFYLNDLRELCFIKVMEVFQEKLKKERNQKLKNSISDYDSYHLTAYFVALFMSLTQFDKDNTRELDDYSSKINISLQQICGKCLIDNLPSSIHAYIEYYVTNCDPLASDPLLKEC